MDFWREVPKVKVGCAIESFAIAWQIFQCPDWIIVSLSHAQACRGLA
jgi:hypothetical protein